VSTQEPGGLERVFPARELFRGEGLRGWIWSILASLSLCGLLLVLGFLGDLLITRGQVTLTASELPRLEGFRGIEIPRDVSTPDVLLADTGVFPTLLRWNPGPFASLGRWLSAVPPLMHNRSALTVLVGLGTLLAWLWSQFASRARRDWNRAGLEVAARLRREIHRQALRLGPGDLDGTVSDQTIALFKSDVDTVREGVVSWLGVHGRDLLRLVLIAGCLLLVEPVLTLVCVVPLLGCWWLAKGNVQRSRAQERLSQLAGDRDLRILAEGLSKTRLVRGYGLESLEQQHFDKSLQRYQRSQEDVLDQTAWSRRAVRILIALTAGFVALYLGGRVLMPPHETPLAWALVVLAGFWLAWRPLQELVSRQSTLEPADRAADRIQAYLTQIPSVGQAVGARFVQPLRRLLTFERVTWKPAASAQALLQELDLKIPAGRKVALVSTDPLEARAVACLIPRFLDPDQGRVLIDDTDIAWGTLDSLRAEAILVSGHDPCISGSVRENLLGDSPGVTLDAITAVAKKTHAHEFIQELPQGYETIIGEQGVMLDPVQSFQLGLARALVRNPALLIIDEPELTLDEALRQQLDETYRAVSDGRTVLFLPRRMSTLRRCDEIAFLHKGRLSAIGPRDRLVQVSPLYRHWEYLRFNEFRHEFESETE
jgi:ATP-binding cassette subfamily B protein